MALATAIELLPASPRNSVPRPGIVSTPAWALPLTRIHVASLSPKSTCAGRGPQLPSGAQREIAQPAVSLQLRPNRNALRSLMPLHRIPRIQDRDAQSLVVPDIARHHRQTVLQRCGCQNPSAILSGRPATWRPALNTPHSSAIASVTGSIRPVNSGRISPSSQSCNQNRRLPVVGR